MKNTLVNFSLGTLSNMPLPPLKNETASIHMEQQSSSQSPTKSRKVSQGSKKNSISGAESLTDGVNIEEINLPEVMLLRASQPGELRRRGTPIDVTMHHEFLAGHLEAITKKDQFIRLKEFENEVIGKQDAAERNVMAGMKAVDHLERKLVEVKLLHWICKVNSSSICPS